MARVTVEDCIDKVDSPYELVLVAKERATQLNAGIEPSIDRDNDKNTVISLREIAEEKIQVSDLTDSAVYKLRKHVEQVDDTAEDDEDIGDDFENLYKGEISKSGTPILPSKRARKTPEKIQVTKEDLAELSETATACCHRRSVSGPAVAQRRTCMTCMARQCILCMRKLAGLHHGSAAVA